MKVGKSDGFLQAKDKKGKCFLFYCEDVLFYKSKNKEGNGTTFPKDISLPNKAMECVFSLPLLGLIKKGSKKMDIS